SPKRRSPSSRTTPTSSASGCRTSSRRISRSSTRPDGLLVVRIALFTNNYLPFCGGVTISVETLRRGLESSGHEAWVFGPRLNGPKDVSDRVVRYPSIPVATYPEFALAVPYSRRIDRLVTALDFDVIHAHHPFLLGPAARRLARRNRRPLVFTYHTRYEKYAHYVPLPLRLVQAAALRISAGFAAQADAVLAPSALIRDELHARGVRTPIAVVPTGVDLQRFRPGDRAAARRSLGVRAADPAACGLPAVAVDAPGCDEVVRDGDTGILTKGDPAALAEAVIGLLLDPERRRAMARRAREMAERLFDVTLQIDRTMAVYADA